MKDIIKFRIKLGGRWHYWGYIDDSFLSPPSVNNESLSIKEIMERSQQYVGRQDDKGVDIYEGDFLSPIPMLENDGIQLVYWCQDVAGFSLSGGLQYDECNLVIGNNIDNPEMLETISQNRLD